MIRSYVDYSMAVVILLVLLGLIVCIALSMIPASMAEKRGRNKVGWFLLSFLLFSSVLCMFFLLCLGETEEKRKERIMEEEELRLIVRRKHTRQESTTETRNLNPSTKTIYDIYKR